MPLVSLFYCTRRVLRTPGYWDRLRSSVGNAVDLTIVFKETGWKQQFRTLDLIQCVSDDMIQQVALYSVLRKVSYVLSI